MTSWEFSVPALPPPGLMPNRSRGSHWGKSYRLGTKWAADVTAYGQQAAGRRGWPHFERVDLELAFAVPATPRYDADNLLAACKAAIDALARRTLRDDNWHHLAHIHASVRLALPGESPSVTFRFTDLAAGTLRPPREGLTDAT